MVSAIFITFYHDVANITLSQELNCNVMMEPMQLFSIMMSTLKAFKDHMIKRILQLWSFHTKFINPAINFISNDHGCKILCIHNDETHQTHRKIH